MFVCYIHMYMVYIGVILLFRELLDHQDLTVTLVTLDRL